MNLKFTNLIAAAALAAVSANAYVIDWDKIEFWTGEGKNKAALVVQFSTADGQENPGALVWGYRWDSGDVNGEDMIRAIAGDNDDFLLLTQYTGDMGNTVCGLGYSDDINKMIDAIQWDMDGVISKCYPVSGGNISFGIMEPNTNMGQTSAPGSDALDFVMEALENAASSHVIEHPLDAAKFGYACYDYDWWKPGTGMNLPVSTNFWNAGWYEGYWSYWVGETTDLDNLGYSGLGMSSAQVSDGTVNGWKYTSLQTADARSGASDQWLAPNYSHFRNGQTAVESVEINTSSPAQFYRLDGTAVARPSEPGVYIMRQGKCVRKILVK